MNQTVTRVLIVEDTPTQAELARAMLGGLGHELRLAATAGAAFTIAQSWAPDAILLDLELPDYSAFDLMRQLRAEAVDAAVIVVTANGSINVAVEAMREGASDFIVKPFTKARLAVTLSNSLEKRALAAQLRSVRARLDRERFFGFLGASSVMQAVYHTIEAVAPSKASVFITGESGTGKELAADAVHRASPRRGRPFVALNCGAIPRNLLESEVFGHVKGAFTGAVTDRVGAAMQADGGTLFLDEIADMPLDMQVKLLRFVQTGTFQPVGASHTERVDVRFVCATNRDPTVEVREGRFREDLFYRLYVVPIDLPPLRARGDDVVLIARHFLTRYAREEGRRFRGFSAEAERLLLNCAWPGNVRQLQNVIRNVVVLHEAERVEASMLPPLLLPPRSPSAIVSPAMASSSVASQPVVSGPVASAPVVSPPVVSPQFVSPQFVSPQFVSRPVVLSYGASAQGVSPGGGAARPPMPPPDIAPPARRGPPGSAETAPVDRRQAMRPIDPDEPEILPLAVVERRMIMAALRHTRQDVPRAAAMLQVNPSTIYRKLNAWRNDPKSGR